MHEQIVEEMTVRMFVVAIIAGLPAIILAAATLITALRSGSKQDRLAQGLNGRLDELLASARRAAEAEGYARGLKMRREGDVPPPIDTGEHRA